MSAPATSILVIKLGALGDFVQALGPFAAIRRHHKDARITLLTTSPYADLAEASGYFNAIWIDERPQWWQVRRWLDLKRRFAEAGFGRVY
ncbi:MAG: ADP-heptose--LPS heptosyltransferase, partial [Proteobacteria bacterium]|nr:ADP-heptose--LPS heptosyltransferase [Pseudomonadota bacterium]